MEGERCDGTGLHSRDVLLPLNIDDFGSDLALLAHSGSCLSNEGLGVLKQLMERCSRRQISNNVHVNV